MVAVTESMNISPLLPFRFTKSPNSSHVVLEPYNLSMSNSQSITRVPFIEKIVKEAQLSSLELQLLALEESLEQMRLKVAMLEQQLQDD